MSAKKVYKSALSAALEFLFKEYLRPYQVKWLRDKSRKRVALKARQVGWSDTIALEMVLVSSGLHPDIRKHNCTIVSKDQENAFDVIKKAKKWVELLRTIPGLSSHLETEIWSASEISFVGSGFRIKSQTQNPNAGRGKSGHLYLDEYAFYQYQREIWTAAIPSVFSTTYLRVSVISTPNGTGDHYHEIWTDELKYPDWSRHKVDVYEAIEEGFPLVVAEVKGDFSADQWAQEMECKFIGGEHEYFPAELLQESHAPYVYDPERVLWLGIDTASVIDTTAVQEVWLQRDGMWLGDTYVIEHLQYETDTQRKRIGQDTVLDALIQHLRPAGAVFDVTGDMARKVRGFASIYKIIKQSRGGEQRILPQTVSKEWKDIEVEEIKTALQSGRTRFIDGRVDYTLSRQHAGEFAHTKFIDRAVVGAFVHECFVKSDFPILTQDFRKIHRKWVGPNNTTFDAERDGTGHADAFWAAVFGHSITRSQRLGATASSMKVDLPELRQGGYSGFL